MLGCFPTSAKAERHFKKCRKQGLIDDVPGFVIPTFEDAVIPATQGRTPAYLQEKAARLHETNVERFRAQKNAFDERLTHRKAGGATVEEDAAEYTAMVAENQQREETAPTAGSDDEDESMFLRDAEGRGQTFFACSFVVDADEAAREDLFVVYAAFDREESATRYVNDTLSEYEEGRHLFVCSCYEWIYPCTSEEPSTMKGIPCTYKHGMLDEIMQKQFNQKGDVAAFRRSEAKYKAEQHDAQHLAPNLQDFNG